MSEPTNVSFIHISDSHFGPDNSYIRIRHGTWACARDLVSIVNGLPDSIDFVIHTGDVAGIVKFAGDRGIPVHSRGAGSGLCGSAVGPGIVVDFSK